MEAISNAGAAIGVLTSGGVVLAAEKRILSKVNITRTAVFEDLLEESTNRKFSHLSSKLSGVFTLQQATCTPLVACSS